MSGCLSWLCSWGPQAEQEVGQGEIDGNVLPCEQALATLPQILGAPGVAPPFMDAPARTIGTILIGNAHGQEAESAYHFAGDLRALAEVCGFVVRDGWNGDTRGQWMRDNQIALSDGSLLLPVHRGDVHQNNVTRMEYVPQHMLPRDSYCFLEAHPDCGQLPLKVFSEEDREREARDAQDVHRLTLRKGHCYIEGGNILVTGRGPIIGMVSLIQTMLALEYQGAFDDELIAARVNELAPDEDLLLATAAGLQRAREDGWEVDVEPATYLAKLDIARDVIASDLVVPRDQITYVEQPGFHLDVGMAVGPDNVILLQDHALSLGLLEELRETTDDAEIHLELEAYLEPARQLSGGLAASTDRIEEQLRAAGYEVLRLPGVFTTGQLGSGGPQVNFFNHLGGTNADGEMFYITNAAPGRSGALLQASFTEQLEKLGYQNVAFIGGDMASRSLGYGGALRCLTCVLPPGNQPPGDQEMDDPPGVVQIEID